MGSKKAAEEASALEKIAEYMRTANRPYSAVDVTTNLRKVDPPLSSAPASKSGDGHLRSSERRWW